MKRTAGMNAFLVLIAAAAVLISVGSGKAQEYPTRPIQLVVPYSPGGTTDLFFRTINESLEKNLGARVEILNKPGGGGIVGTSSVVNSKPDGYTLVDISPENTTIATAFTPSMPYDPKKDLTYIAKGSVVAVSIAVRANSPFKTFEDLVAYAKANPGKLKAGGMGIVGTPHMIFGVWTRDAKLNMGYVPFDGGGELAANTLGGHVDFSLVSLSAIGAHVASGKIRMLAVASPRRLSNYPDIPTFAEKGYPKASFAISLGLGGPPKMPALIVEKWEKAMEKTLKDPKVIETVGRLEGVVIDYKSGADYYKELMDNADVFKEIAATAPKK